MTRDQIEGLIGAAFYRGYQEGQADHPKDEGRASMGLYVMGMQFTLDEMFGPRPCPNDPPCDDCLERGWCDMGNEIMPTEAEHDLLRRLQDKSHLLPNAEKRHG